MTTVGRLQRSTLGDGVYDALTALIMEHTLAPGDRVNIDALARQLEVSATPVREALARLESDGLVRKRALAGYTVSPLLTRSEFMDMFDMRLVLEGAAARWAAERADEALRAQISNEAARTIAPVVDGHEGWSSHAAFTTLDAQFHDLIADAARNPLLREGIARLHSHLHIHRLFFPHGKAGTTGQEHQKIAAAIQAGQPDKAQAAMHEHLTRARERHLAAFGGSIMASQLGRSAVAVTPLGFGAASIGNLYRQVSDEQAALTIDTAWQAGIRYFDTAPHYGIGLSESRLGKGLSAYPRESYTLSTKVGRILVPDPDGASRSDLDNGFDVPAVHRRVWDFSAQGVRRSLEASLARLGLDSVDIVLIHDPDESADPAAGVRDAYPALDELRRQGVVRAIGVGSKDPAVLASFAEETDVDVLMIAGRYTLLEQPALDHILPVCQRRGISVLNVGVFNSGLLAVPMPDETRTYEYGTVPAEVLRRARAIAEICERHGTTLPQAAIAFAGAHPAVASVVVGAGKPDHILRSVQWHDAPKPPSALWEELVAQGLLRPDAPVP